MDINIDTAKNIIMMKHERKFYSYVTAQTHRKGQCQRKSKPKQSV
jgi:hypothetical protein